MERFLLITHYTPTKDNYNGPSALMYHLLKNRPSNIQLNILSYNRNRVPNRVIIENSKILNATINLISKRFYNRFFTSNKVNRILKFLRIRKLSADCYYSLPSSTLRSIDSFKPQLIFIYPHTSLKIAKQLHKYKIIVCGPDCVSLHYSRLLRDEYSFKYDKIKELMLKYYNRLLMEKEWGKLDNVLLYLVGQVDCTYFNIINNKIKAYFFPHPHYELANKTISFQHQIKILISGKYDLYTYADITNLVLVLENNKNLILKNNFSLTFLGKGWEVLSDRLKKVGYNVNNVSWVNDYTDFITNFDVQIFPISVGSGTKGKVLDALSIGLLCIGSKYAFENIAVENTQSCVMYNDVEEIPAILNYLYYHKEEYEQIAKKGREIVRLKHSPSFIINSIIEFVKIGKYEFNFNDYFKLDLK